MSTRDDNDDDGFYSSLKDRACDCSVNDFKELLFKFGNDPRAVKAMQQAVSRLGQREDPGSWCENASRGYGDYIRKKELLADFRLGMGEFKEDFNQRVARKSAPPSAVAPTTIDGRLQALKGQTPRIKIRH